MGNTTTVTVRVPAALKNRLDRLADGTPCRASHLGRPGREPETRELIVAGTPYIIAYRIYRGRLCILAVLHAP